jgi:hypothetical protein
LIATAHEEVIRPHVLTAVEDMAARGASGVLEVTGSPSGALYLDGGRIAFARASWVPGLVARLRALLPALAGLGEFSSGGDADDAAVAAFAVQRGYLTRAGLHELARSIVVDAFLVLTVPLAMEFPAAAIRFTSTRTYWTDVFPRLGVDLVRAEAVSIAERMAEHGLAPTTVVSRCDLQAPAAVLTREQWAVACHIGDHASALDVAARRGAALSDTLDCLGGLTRAGLCAPVRAGGHGPSPAGLPGRAGRPVQPPRPHADKPRADKQHADRAHADGVHADRLPLRPTVHDLRVRPDGPLGPGQAPTADILRQVLNGLRKLS